MIPFRLHRRLPLIRRPFDARDAAMAEVRHLRARLDEVERDAAATRGEPGLSRTQDLKAVYSHQVDRTVSSAPLEEAMSTAIGGDFDYIGRVEVATVKRFGLGPADHVVDVGCGSGRLAIPLSPRHEGGYSGFDVVERLVTYARERVRRPDWRFDTVDHIAIPEPDGRADMVCFFSVLTHLLHEQSYWYLEEARRVVKPGGIILASFLEFSEPEHWPVFVRALDHARTQHLVDPVSVFIERAVFGTWAERLGLEVVAVLGNGDAIEPDLYLGQSLCVLRRPGP